MSLDGTTWRGLEPQPAFKSFEPEPDGLKPGPVYRSAPETKRTGFDFPEAPIYVEKYSSFLCESAVSHTPMKVVGSLCGYFEKANHIDYTLKKRSKKIKGVAYVNNEPVSFKVCVWRKNGDLLVECQRRRGDALAFATFYSDLKAALGSLVAGGAPKASLGGMKFVSQDFSAPSLNALDAPPLLTADSPAMSALDMIELGSELAGMVQEADAQNDTVTLDSTTMSILCGMVDQETGQCKYDAARMLATLSANPSNQKALATFTAAKAGKFVNVVKTLLQAPDPEIARCGSTLAANLANNTAVRGDLLESLLDSLIVSIQAPELSLLDRERKRQSAQALSLMSESHAMLMRSAAGRLGSCKASTTDRRLQTTLNTVLNRIV